MRFAENNRISHRQLYRQIIMAFTAPFLLCLFGRRRMMGMSGLIGTVLALAVLFFYVIFLIRLRHGFTDPVKSVGKTAGRLVGLFFLLYCVLTAAFLLDLLGEIVSVSLGTGISREWLCFLALLACSYGTYGGIQRRGRVAEVSGGLVLAAVVLMLLLSVGQGKWSYFQEMVWNSGPSVRRIIQYGYGLLCAFSGLSLLPFVFGNVEKAGSAGKTVLLAVGTLGILLLLVELILPSVFGWKRLLYENYPILPLLSGADLPGNVLARFDVLWMGFLLYSLLFSVGSLLHYGHFIVEKAGLGTGIVWITVLVFLAAVLQVGNVGIRDYFRGYLENIFVPGMLVIQVILFFAGRGKWKKKGEHKAEKQPDDAAKRKEDKTGKVVVKNEEKGSENKSIDCVGARCKRRKIFSMIFIGVFSMLLLSGCGGVEPEKRMYPLGIGADFEDGNFVLTYGIPDLPKATGQEKNGEDQGNMAPSIRGADFNQIEKIYSRTQEKYLDLGHLEILVLGQSVLDEGKWEEVLEYLKQEPTVGENVYVFRTKDAATAVSWVSPQETSLGEYILGLLENDPDGSPKEAVTLRDVYYEWYERGGVPGLPEIETMEDTVEVGFEK